MADLSIYEQNAHREIDLFKNPPRSWLGDAWETVNKPIEWVGDVAFDNPCVFRRDPGSRSDLTRAAVPTAPGQPFR